MNKKIFSQLEDLLTIVSREGASDLHVSVGRHPHIRVHGNLIPITNYDPSTAEDVMGFLDEMLPQDEIQQLNEKEEVDFSYIFAPAQIRFRGNAFIQSDKVSFALRSIKSVQGLQELNLPPVLEQFARKKQGFFLIVGPVGQGKSTTMAALIDLINQNRREHIVTIEHPIEYLFEEKNSIIDQREVGVDTESFQTGLVSALRQDVNVLMIGEMRNPETISAAVTAAETGHLVFSTLHTNNAAQTIDRIIDSFPPGQQDQIRIQLAGSLLGVFSQRLIPRLRGGRVPAYELMINNNAISNLIREKRTHEIETFIETGYESGMIDMNRSLIDLVRSGDISIEDARRYSFNPQAFDQLLG